MRNYSIEIDDKLWATLTRVSKENGIDVPTLIRAGLRLIGTTYDPKKHGPVVFANEVIVEKEKIVDHHRVEQHFHFHSCHDFAGMTLVEVRHFLVLHSLKRHAGNKVKVASELGTTLRTVYNYLEDAERYYLQKAEDESAALEIEAPSHLSPMEKADYLIEEIGKITRP